MTASTTTFAIDLPLARIAALCAAHGVAELSLFGSALGSEFRPDSDVDFLVVYSQVHGLFEHFALQRELADAIGRPVDLVFKEGLKRVIRDEVLNSARVVYAAK